MTLFSTHRDVQVDNTCKLLYGFVRMYRKIINEL